jgi:hypothetical protein
MDAMNVQRKPVSGGSYITPVKRNLPTNAGGHILKNNSVPIWEKSNLTLEEAAAYSGIGINKLRQITNDEDCSFVLWVGSKRLLKRRLMDEYFEAAYSI